MAESMHRYAVVTGENKGIGLEICKQLACKGITVVLTTRDEKRGLEALENLKHCGLLDHLVFHQLDVADPASIASLADFVKKLFGKLHILVNNAGVRGVNIDRRKIYYLFVTSAIDEEKQNELSSGPLRTGPDSGSWPTALSAYTVSKVAMDAHTRILAKKYPNFYINCVCPDFVKTDINFNMGKLTVEEGAASPVKLALLPNGGPFGLFFNRSEPASFDSDN
ncbi:LOW QUALITY PROTEIN: (+)-neomenthol dehydrogenase-like [Herrania umbratica]|uniref:LOW QUALITY PROTEIN: (+)-neomenthol dehydrogenase-like n=1 Tax=Herrania umbratica TaxID=108875 RepID=A0A6J0ZXZ9_9ROSI|nr:LOW QUALITY PROTEIN: (+)-neomenthol dehydrogenase-like [Herrania umbratica]